MPDLSIVIPCFNEEKKIGADVAAALAYCNSRPYTFELILVDDGSSDRTPEMLRAFEQGHSGTVRAICYRPNRGKGYAVRTGMLAARGRFRLFADAGLCVPFREVEKGLALLDRRADVAIASRTLAGAQIVAEAAGYRQIGSKLFRLLVRYVMGLRYTDTQCGFKLFTAHAAQELFSRARIDGFMFDAEMLMNARKLGLMVKEFPVKWRADPDTRYKPLSGSIRNLIELMRIQWPGGRARSGQTAP